MVNKYFLPPGRVGTQFFSPLGGWVINFSPPWEGGDST